MGFRSPCLLSSCSFWRVLSRWAAWGGPAELEGPRTHACRPDAAPPDRCRLQLPFDAALVGRRRIPVTQPFPHGNHTTSSTDILPVASDLRRQRKCGGDRGRSQEAACGGGAGAAGGGACVAGSGCTWIPTGKEQELYRVRSWNTSPGRACQEWRRQV